MWVQPHQDPHSSTSFFLCTPIDQNKLAVLPWTDYDLMPHPLCTCCSTNRPFPHAPREISTLSQFCPHKLAPLWAGGWDEAPSVLLWQLHILKYTTLSCNTTVSIRWPLTTPDTPTWVRSKFERRNYLFFFISPNSVAYTQQRLNIHGMM